jgi:hypothetical protein
MWSRSGDMYFMSGHVNLQLDRQFADASRQVDRFATYTIDFMPSPEARRCTRTDQREHHPGDVHEQPRRRGDGGRPARQRVLARARGRRLDPGSSAPTTRWA